MPEKNMDMKKCPMPVQDPDVRNKNFDEVALGYTYDMAVNEARRCLNCKNNRVSVPARYRSTFRLLSNGLPVKIWTALLTCFPSPRPFLPYADASARRKHSARANVCAASKASR